MVEQVMQSQFALTGYARNNGNARMRHLHLCAVTEQGSITYIAANTRLQHYMIIDDLLNILKILHAIITRFIPCRTYQGSHSRASYITIVEKSTTIAVGTI